MRHYLPAFWSTVDDQPIAPFGHSLLLGELPGTQHHPANQTFITRVQFLHGPYVLSGQKQDMSRGDRVNIPECDDLDILVDNISRYLAGHDAAEDTVCCHRHPPKGDSRRREALGEVSAFVLADDELVLAELCHHNLMSVKCHRRLSDDNILVHVIKPLPAVRP